MKWILALMKAGFGTGFAAALLIPLGCIQLPLVTGAGGANQGENARDAAKACESALVTSPANEGTEVRADDIPVAHTPVAADGSCGWIEWPTPILADCTEPLVEGAPDLRGVWQVVEGDRVGHIERIEQCGDRVVITSGGVIHDMRADGTLANGVRDVSALNCAPLEVAADFVSGTRLELRPFGGPVVLVVRERTGEDLILNYLGNTSRMQRLCGASE